MNLEDTQQVIVLRKAKRGKNMIKGRQEAIYEILNIVHNENRIYLYNR